MSSSTETKPLLRPNPNYSSVQQEDSPHDGPPPSPSRLASILSRVKGVFARSATSSSSASSSAASSASSEGTSWYLSVFLVVNAALGSAFLNFPRAFDQAGGVGAALGVQSILLLIASATLIILAYSSDASNASNYQDVILGVLGARAGLACSIVITLYCFGTCITFLIIIGDQWDRFFYSYTGEDPLFCHTFYMHRRFTIVVSSLVFILPLCYPKRIDFLKYAAFAGVLANVYLDFLQVYCYYTGDYAEQTGHIKTGPDDWTDLFLVAPTIFFGYQCHVSSVPIYACLKKRTVTEFLKTVLTAMAVCAGTYSVAATYGYWTFGSNVDADILTNYNANDPLVLAGLIAMAFKTYTTYPLIIFCGRTGVDSLCRIAWKRWRRRRELEEVEEEMDEDAVWEEGEKWRRIVTVTFWFSTTIAISMFVPGIDYVIPVLGAFAAGFIVIFPGLCLLEVALLRLEKQQRQQQQRQPLVGDAQARYDDGSAEIHVSIVDSAKRDWAGLALLWSALFLLVFGAFMLGIIVVNSVSNINPSVALCT